MTKSKLTILLLAALMLGGCDVSASAVSSSNASQFYVSVFCSVGLFISKETCQLYTAQLPPSTDAPFSLSDAAPFTIWIAEANSATAMSDIQFDPSTSSSPTIMGVPVFSGKHAGGITAWLNDSTKVQHGLYLWHDNTIEVLNANGGPIASIQISTNGAILDFTLSSDGVTGAATVKNDSELYLVDVPGRNVTKAIHLGLGANPRAVTLAMAPGAPPVVYATDAVNGTLYISDQSGSVTSLKLTPTPTELGKPALLPDGTQLWVPDVTQNSIFVVSPGSNRFTSFTLPNLFDPREIVFSRDGKTAYILFSPPASFGPGSLAIVNTSDYTLINSVKLGTTPSGLALSPQGTYAFVANSGDGNVAAIDSSNNVITYKVGTTPVGVVATH